LFRFTRVSTNGISMQLLTVIKNNTGNRAAVITSSLKARCEFGSLVQVSEESATIIVRRMQANCSNILVNSYPVVVTLYSSCTRDNGLKMDQLDKRKFRFYSFYIPSRFKLIRSSNRPVARKMPVWGLCPQTWMHWTVTPTLGVRGIIPRKIFFEILCSKTCNFVHFCSSKSCTSYKCHRPLILRGLRHVHRHNFCTLNSVGSSGLGVCIILKVSPDNLVIR